MTIEQGLRAKYKGKVLARALRAYKEQWFDDIWTDLGSAFIWYQTKEGNNYWNALSIGEANPDKHLPKDYIDVDDEDVSLISEVNNSETLDAPTKNTSESTHTKQTSVQWLFDQLVPSPTLTIRQAEILMEAKEMFERQVKDAFVDGSERGTKNIPFNCEQYYNQTYKSPQL